MHTILTLVLAVGLAAADVGLGYNYKPPTSFATYGVPSYQATTSFGQYNSGYNGNGLNYKVTGQTGHEGSNLGFLNAASNAYQTHGGYQSYRPTVIKGNAFEASSSFQNNYQGIYNGGNIPRESVQYQGAQFGNYANLNGVSKVHTLQNSYQLVSQPAQIFKHFYVHAAPEDEEPPKPRTPVVLPPPQKHYKIIFIKTPTQHASAPQVIPVPQQNEEKTIVYVLVNKPEEAQNVVLPKIEQKPPAKPEVFFIKYNHKDGPQAAIDNIVKDYNNGQSVSFSEVNAGSPAPPLLFETYGTPSSQVGGDVLTASSVPQIVSNSGFGISNAQSEVESSFASKPLALGTSGVSDGTLSSTFVGTGTTASSLIDNGFSSASSGTGFNGASSSAGFNSASSGAGFNTVTSGPAYNGASSSTGLLSGSGTAFNSASSGTGLNTATSSTGYNGATSSTGLLGGSGSSFSGVSGGSAFNSASGNSGISSTGTTITESEFNGSTISTSQDVPHESYVTRFRP